MAVAMNKAEKDFIVDKFTILTTLVNAHFIAVDERLAEIERQTKATNGRVTELEKGQIKHIIDCPVLSKVQKINDDLEDYRVVLKHPRIFIGVIVFLVIIALATFTAESPIQKLFAMFHKTTTTEATK